MNSLEQAAHPPRAVARPRRSALTITALALLALCALGAHGARAQEAAPSPAKSERELQLEEQKRILTLEKDIAVAEKEIREAQPKPTTTPLAGTTTVDANVNIEASILSFKAVAAVSNNIACEVYTAAHDAQTIAIFNAKDFNDWRNYKTLFPTLKEQLENLSDRYDELLPRPAAPSQDDQSGRSQSNKLFGFSGGLLAGANAIRSFVDLLSIFRTDTEIKGVAVTVKPSALTPEILRALKDAYRDPSGTCSVYNQDRSIVQPPRVVSLFYPEVFSPKVLEESPTVLLVKDAFMKKANADDYLVGFDVREAKAKELREAIKETKGKIAALEGQAASLADEKAELEWELEVVKATPAHTAEAKAKKRVQIARLTAAIAKRTTAIAETADAIIKTKTKLGEQNAELEAIPAVDLPTREKVARLRKLNEQFDKFMESFVKPDASGNSGLALFVKAENMEQAIEGDKSYWLQVEPVLAGGNNRTQRNLIRYFIGAKLTHSGGVIAEYVLANKKGEVVRSNTTPEYTGYRSSSRIR
jgi:hypothetical protein